MNPITQRQALDYEIRSWWAPLCGWWWLQNFAAWWFERKTRRKYGRYLLSLAEKARVEGRERE